MYGVEIYGKVRRACMVEGMSRREAARRFGIDRRTVSKMLEHSIPPGYCREKLAHGTALGEKGKREYIQVMRLLETFGQAEVRDGIKAALNLGAVSYDAVKHLVLCRIEDKPPRLDLQNYPHLPRARVETTSAESCTALMPGGRLMNETPQVLLKHYLKKLKLPTMLREYEKTAKLCAAEKVDHTGFLLRLVEMELIDRDQRAAQRRIKAAGFPAIKNFDAFDFTAIPSLNKVLALELPQGEFINRRENVLAVGNSGTGKTHPVLALGLSAC